MIFTESELQDYRVNGYVIIPCPFPHELTAACSAAVERVSVAPSTVLHDAKRNHYRLKPQTPNSYWCELDHSLPFLQIALHPEIVELGRQMAGDNDIYFRNGGINELAPGRSFVWHRDSEYEYVEFMHYFSGATCENGCLRVIPGSHIGEIDGLMERVKTLRQQDSAPNNSGGGNCADVELPGEVAIEIAPHHMIVRSSRIFHATYANQTQESRLMNHWLFRESSADNHRFDFTKYLTSELIACLTPEQREVLWLGREFSLDTRWAAEREREIGKVYWSV
jgi:ectoine hydroxylase-related dioxygenase (phytanoyl-CoA dioxygenase family)